MGCGVPVRGPGPGTSAVTQLGFLLAEASFLARRGESGVRTRLLTRARQSGGGRPCRDGGSWVPHPLRAPSTLPFAYGLSCLARWAGPMTQWVRRGLGVEVAELGRPKAREHPQEALGCVVGRPGHRPDGRFRGHVCWGRALEARRGRQGRGGGGSRQCRLRCCSGPRAESCWDPRDVEKPQVPPAWARGSQRPDPLGGQAHSTSV